MSKEFSEKKEKKQKLSEKYNVVFPFVECPICHEEYDARGFDIHLSTCEKRRIEAEEKAKSEADIEKQFENISSANGIVRELIRNQKAMSSSITVINSKLAFIDTFLEKLQKIKIGVDKIPENIIEGLGTFIVKKICLEMDEYWRGFNEDLGKLKNQNGLIISLCNKLKESKTRIYGNQKKSTTYNKKGKY